MNGTVLLIGASRGLGYAIAAEYIARGAQVVGTVRGPARTMLHDLQETVGGRLEIEHVDIDAPEQVQSLHDRLGTRSFDLLFVNAGVTNRPEETTADVTTEEFTRLMVTNALSPMRVIETLGELVVPDGTIAIMSSGQGKTDLGGPSARLTISESIPNLVTTIDAQRGHAGLQYLDYLGQTVAW